MDADILNLNVDVDGFDTIVAKEKDANEAISSNLNNLRRSSKIGRISLFPKNFGNLPDFTNLNMSPQIRKRKSSVFY